MDKDKDLNQIDGFDLSEFESSIDSIGSIDLSGLIKDELTEIKPVEPENNEDFFIFDGLFEENEQDDSEEDLFNSLEGLQSDLPSDSDPTAWITQFHSSFYLDYGGLNPLSIYQMPISESDEKQTRDYFIKLLKYRMLSNYNESKLSFLVKNIEAYMDYVNNKYRNTEKKAELGLFNSKLTQFLLEANRIRTTLSFNEKDYKITLDQECDSLVHLVRDGRMAKTFYKELAKGNRTEILKLIRKVIKYLEYLDIQDDKGIPSPLEFKYEDIGEFEKEVDSLGVIKNYRIQPIQRGNKEDLGIERQKAFTMLSSLSVLYTSKEDNILAV